jgi:protoporphyrinogen IX oxidase
MDGTALALVVHVVGFTIWVGGLFAVALFLSAAGDDPATRARIGAIARRVARATDAGAGLAIVGGVSLLLMHSWDLREPWMHLKLTFVVGLLAVHGIVRVRAKKLANGGPAPTSIAAVAVAALAVAIVVAIIVKPFAR